MDREKLDRITDRIATLFCDPATFIAMIKYLTSLIQSHRSTIYYMRRLPANVMTICFIGVTKPDTTAYLITYSMRR